MPSVQNPTKKRWLIEDERFEKWLLLSWVENVDCAVTIVVLKHLIFIT